MSDFGELWAETHLDAAAGGLSEHPRHAGLSLGVERAREHQDVNAFLSVAEKP
jgi:hypothetical protein